jgi:hypothetical protein
MEERRKDNIKMELDIATIKERLNNHIISTDQFRISLRDDLKEIFKKLGDLPCMARAEITRSLRMRMNWLYGIVGGVVVGLLLELFKR